MIDFYQYLVLFFVSIMLTGFCVLAYDKVVVGKVPYKLLDESTIREILTQLHLKPHQTFVDLGCGDARVLIEATKIQPKLQCIGIERAIFPYLLARYKTRHYHNIHILLRDARRYDFSKSNMVFVYLLPNLLDDLIPSFKQVLDNEHKMVTVEYKPRGLETTKSYSLKHKSQFAEHWYLYTKI